MGKNTVKLKLYANIVNEYVVATAKTVIPGQLVEMTSTSTKIQPHSTAGGNAAPMFALEDELQGKDLGDTFAAGDRVQVLFAPPGSEVLAILADGQNVSIGDFLESNGAGYLQKHTADALSESWESGSKQEGQSLSLTVYPKQIVAQALEAVDLSQSSGEEESSETIGYNKRIKVRIV